MVELKTNKHTISVTGGEKLDINLSFNEIEVGLEIIKLEINSPEPINMPKITISWDHPLIDIHSYWHPTAFRHKSLHADWDRGFFSKATISAPVACLYSSSGENKLTCAYSDSLDTINVNMGVHEEDGTLACKIVLFTEPSKKRFSYKGELRIDTRTVPYYQSIKEVSSWWESYEQYKPAFVPEAARQPMYSTWYSFHQQLVETEIEKQCETAKALGCEAIIVDDGWQTSDNNRGYAYCGDWQVSKERISDMKAHVKRVHEIGLKYILWYSVPFVGLRSAAWNIFKDYTLCYYDNLKAGVLDPRYPQVREYLISVYENAIREWDLDGLKLDFIDQFDLPGEKIDQYNDMMDFLSVQEAVDCLFSSIIHKLRAIKPDIMLEFRQRYIGPYMRKYGNMFRVTDCPNDPITNRIGTMDIRLLCGNTAAHSDMLMWNANETCESAALQLINVLFSVPQFSMKFDNLSEEHFKTTTFWLKFWKKHRNVLMDGNLVPYNPELNYPLITSTTKEEHIVVAYSNVVAPIGKDVPSKLILVNGTLNNRMILELEDNLHDVTLEVLDCFGEVIRNQKLNLNKGFSCIDIPAAGVAYLAKA